MRITEDSPDRLVLQEQTIWISVICGAAAVWIGAVSVLHQAWRPLVGAALFACFGILFIRKSRVEISRSTHTVIIKITKPFNWRTVRLRFDEVKDVVIEPDAMQSNRTPSCRLALTTSSGSQPLSEVYSGGYVRYESMRESVLAALGRPIADALEASLRHLVTSRRIIEAVELLRSQQKMGLAAARQRVEEVQREIGSS
ncbi:MAG TPA: hypothetical protein VNZ06_07245 [Steroidobacteraceae bacterium]|jgi:hypothetical protein|nr:hypothetical protein [Steroidobacteraceae bacterium]